VLHRSLNPQLRLPDKRHWALDIMVHLQEDLVGCYLCLRSRIPIKKYKLLISQRMPVNQQLHQQWSFGNLLRHKELSFGNLQGDLQEYWYQLLRRVSSVWKPRTKTTGKDQYGSLYGILKILLCMCLGWLEKSREHFGVVDYV
jgi:hypothetical protein